MQNNILNKIELHHNFGSDLYQKFVDFCHT